MLRVYYTYLSEKYLSVSKSLFNLYYHFRVNNSEQIRCTYII